MRVSIVCGEVQVEIADVDPERVDASELAALARDLIREIKSSDRPMASMGFAVQDGRMNGKVA